jgi:hypothetical protein
MQPPQPQQPYWGNQPAGPPGYGQPPHYPVAPGSPAPSTMPSPVRVAQVISFVVAGIGLAITIVQGVVVDSYIAGRDSGLYFFFWALAIIACFFGRGRNGIRITATVFAGLQALVALSAIGANISNTTDLHTTPTGETLDIGPGLFFGPLNLIATIVIVVLLYQGSSSRWFKRPRIQSPAQRQSNARWWLLGGAIVVVVVLMIARLAFAVVNPSVTPVDQEPNFGQAKYSTQVVTDSCALLDATPAWAPQPRAAERRKTTGPHSASLRCQQSFGVAGQNAAFVLLNVEVFEEPRDAAQLYETYPIHDQDPSAKRGKLTAWGERAYFVSRETPRSAEYAISMLDHNLTIHLSISGIAPPEQISLPQVQQMCEEQLRRILHRLTTNDAAVLSRTRTMIRPTNSPVTVTL